MSNAYDMIVVGARCAGSPTAMLLARKGYRVLLLDRATFPSDTLSTHWIHAPGVAALKRWGLLQRVAATGCPPISTYSFDFGPFTVTGTPRPTDGVATAYGPRRTVLDALLVEAAVEAGVEMRQDFSVDDLLFERGRVIGIRGRKNGGSQVEERASLVIGADGRQSLVARAVQPPAYAAKPTFEAGYYAYWSGMPRTTFEVWVRPGRSFAALPTNDGLTCVVATWPITEFEANRADIEGNYMKTLHMAAALAERLRGCKRESAFAGTGDLPGYFRQPFGPGWALVGDAGYRTDPCTAQGITDAFQSAELLVAAIEAWTNGQDFDVAMAGYQRARDEAAMPLYELTSQIATLEPPPPHVAQLLAAASQSQRGSDDWASVIAGTLPVGEFFASAQTAA
jgi:2-polyprenyl-6-methoxyphenol hydroxylase-like FAD-dependent oxidoreductase